MSDMSVQMILKLVDQVSGPAKGIETELEKLQRAAKTLDDIGKGTPSKAWDDRKRVIQDRISELEGLQKAEQATTRVVVGGAQAQASAGAAAHERQIAAIRAERAEQQRLAADAAAARAAKEKQAAVDREATRLRQLEREKSSRPPVAADDGMGMIGALAGGHEAAKLTREIAAAGGRAAETAVGLATQGNSTADLATIQQEAARLSQQFRLFSRTTIENMIGDAKSYTGSLEHAIAAMPDLLRLRTIQEGMHGTSNEHDFAGLVRAAEIAGATASPEKLRSFFDMTAKIMEVFRETLNPQSFAQFYSQTSSYGRHLSQRFMMGAGAHLMQELGPGEAGNAIAMWEQALEAGTMQPKAMEQFDKLGLLDQTKVRRKSNGEIRWIDPGGIKGYQLALTDPDLWEQQFLKPALEKLPPDVRDAAEQALFSNKSVRTAHDKMLNQDAIIEKDRKFVEAAPGLPASDTWANNSPHVAQKAVQAQTENAERAASELFASSFTWLANSAAGLLSHFNSFFDEHKGRATEAGVLGVGAAAVGTAKIAAETMRQLGRSFGEGAGLVAARGAAAAAKGGPGGSLLSGASLMGVGIDGGGGWTWAGAGRSLLKGLGKGLIAGIFEEAAEFGMHEAVKAQEKFTTDKILDSKYGNDEAAKERARARLAAETEAWKHASLGDTLWSLFRGGQAPWERPGSEGLLKVPGEPERKNTPNQAPYDYAAGAPSVDNSQLDDTKTKAESAKQTLDLLNGTVTPKIDLVGLEQFIQKATQAKMLLQQLGSFSGGTRSFAPSSPALHDGPEAR